MQKKFIALLTLSFYLLGFCTSPRPVQANPLALIPAAAVGAVILAAAGTQYALQNPSSGESGFSIDSYTLKRDMLAYSKVLQGTRQMLIGKAITGVVDLEQAYNKGLLQTKQKLNDVINQIFPPGTPYPDTTQYASPSDIYPDGVLASSCQSYINQGQTFKPNRAPYNQSNASSSLADAGFTVQCGPTYIYYYHSYLDGRWERNTLEGYWYPNPATWPTEDGPPPYLEPSRVPQLAQGINSAALSDPDVADELDDLIKANPGVVVPSPVEAQPSNPGSIADYPPVPPISQQDLKSFIDNAIGENNANYIGALEALAAAHPEDPALQQAVEAAKADAIQEALDEAKDEADLQADVPALSSSSIKEVDFSPITSLSGAMQNTFPFGLLAQLHSGLSVLSAPAVAPSFTIDGGFFQQEVTLGVFDSLATFVRAVMGFFLYCLTAVMVVRLFARM